MSEPSLNLLVLRCEQLEDTRSFYEALGLVFEAHQHGKGPRHWGAQAGPVVIELYPASARHPADATRVGLAVDGAESAIERALAAGGAIDRPLADSPWGRRAVLVDPEGRKVELTVRD